MATVPLLEDDTLAFGEEYVPIKGRPIITFFHLAFRSAAILAYLFCKWFSDSFITNFVVIVILLSMDFWTVKNITGRLMVGLRWWNYVDEEGKSHWVYESKKGSEQNRINEKEASVFWIALVVTPLIWSVFFIVALFRFDLKWLLLVIISLILNGANLYGYIKCKVGNADTLSNLTSTFFGTQMLQNAVKLVARQSNTTNTMHSPTNTV